VATPIATVGTRYTTATAVSTSSGWAAMNRRTTPGGLGR
jgi:hypothetical protein